MPVCPHCQAQTDAPYQACPNGDGFYTIDEDAYHANAGDPLLGRAIDDRYIVDDLLGQGSMARVYRAFQTKVDRPIALKVFFAEKIANSMLPHRDPSDVIEVARSRFTQEAKVLGKIAHPNCVTVYDFGVAEGGEVLYIAMEYVAGISLRRAIRRGLKYKPILEIIQQILLGLREAHGVGIVHQDLKPENIILSFRFASEEQVVKVVDFGIASLLGQDLAAPSREGALFGTPAYMSPEQCRSDYSAIGPHTDIYSLGCIIFEMLSGHLPYQTKRPHEMVKMHMESPVPEIDLRSDLGEIPDSLVDFVRRCMSKEPAGRYRDGQEALIAFSDIIDGANITEGSGLISTADLMRRRASQGGEWVRGGRVTVPQNQISGEEIEPPVLHSEELEVKNVLAEDISQELPSIIARDTIPPGFGGAVKNADFGAGKVTDTLPPQGQRARSTPLLQRSVVGIPMPFVLAFGFVLLAVLATFAVIFSTL